MSLAWYISSVINRAKELIAYTSIVFLPIETILSISVRGTETSSDFLLTFYHLDVVIWLLKNFRLHHVQNTLFNSSKPFKKVLKLNSYITYHPS
ncbi:MAG: hypothetical protein CG441_966 [Methylococcaceae bacterium NSM2-1]|jgi:hypothetical protein|nr:MAG: hypothetical protein CG441_966 [Methylococcaceae bacterium NSM2-1]